MILEWSKMYDIGVCDDGFEICGFIQKVIKEDAATHNNLMYVKTWHTGEELKEYLGSGNSLDLLSDGFSDKVNIKGTDRRKSGVGYTIARGKTREI